MLSIQTQFDLIYFNGIFESIEMVLNLYREDATYYCMKTCAAKDCPAGASKLKSLKLDGLEDRVGKNKSS